MKKLMTDNHADVKMVGTVVAIFVTLIVSILVLFAIAGSISFSTAQEREINAARGYPSGAPGATHESMDQYNNTTSAGNATTDILDQAGTFFQIAPIIGIVLVAVVILTYVGKIGAAT